MPRVKYSYLQGIMWTAQALRAFDRWQRGLCMLVHAHDLWHFHVGILVINDLVSRTCRSETMRSFTVILGGASFEEV